MKAMRNGAMMRQLAAWGGALAMAACANTAGSGTTTTTDTGSGLGGFDAGTGGGGTGGGGTGGADAGSATGGTDSGTATGGGTDSTASAGQTLTIAEVQKQSVTTDCAKIVNTLNGVSVFGMVVASPVSVYKGVATAFVQTKGGGAHSGLLLMAKSPGAVDGLKIGDVVDVVPGNVKEFYCLTELEPKTADSLMKTGATELPVAVTIDVAKVGAKASEADNRSFESAFVSLEGVTVTGAGKPNKDGNVFTIWVGKSAGDQQLEIGNGFKTYVIGSDKKTPNFKEGQKLNVQGFMEFTYGAWQLVPISIGVVP
jgi:hypothetical protein